MLPKMISFQLNFKAYDGSTVLNLSRDNRVPQGRCSLGKCLVPISDLFGTWDYLCNPDGCDLSEWPESQETTRCQIFRSISILHLEIKCSTLKMICLENGSQCSFFNTRVMCSYFYLQVTIRAAELLQFIHETLRKTNKVHQDSLG